MLSLTACEEVVTTTVIEPAPPLPSAAPTTVLPPDPGPLVIAEPTLGDGLEGLPDPAVATCMSAVAQQTNNPAVTAMQIEDGIAGSTVLIGVGETRAPWECRVDRSGAVVAVTSLTGEGGL
jgi:hypothetical protein